MSFDLLKDINKKVHFIGIGGVSMSGLAAVLLNAGYKVSGSDSKESEITNRLKEEGAKMYLSDDEPVRFFTKEIDDLQQYLAITLK